MRAEDFHRALCGDLVDLELGPATDAERERAQRWVAERLQGAGEVTRLGLDSTGAALAAAVRIRHGDRYDALPDAVRHDVARRLAGTRAPVISEYVRAIRALAITYVFELRHATAP